MATEIIIDRLGSSAAEFGSSGDQHSPQLAVKQSINHANGAVFEAARTNPDYLGMGTTLVHSGHGTFVNGTRVDRHILRLERGRIDIYGTSDSRRALGAHALPQRLHQSARGAPEMAPSLSSIAWSPRSERPAGNSPWSPAARMDTSSRTSADAATRA